MKTPLFGGTTNIWGKGIRNQQLITYNKQSTDPFVFQITYHLLYVYASLIHIL